MQLIRADDVVVFCRMTPLQSALYREFLRSKSLVDYLSGCVSQIDTLSIIMVSQSRVSDPSV